jgi:Tfp pilus assembly protein PilN
LARTLKGEGRVAFGLFADSSALKFAHLSIKRGRVTLRELRTVTLPNKLEERGHGARGFDEKLELPSDAEHASDDILLKEPEKDQNIGVLADLLSQYPPKKFVIAYSLAEPSVYYHALERPFEPKIRRLKKVAIEELAVVRSAGLSPDTVDLIPSHEKGTLCVVREDGLKLLDLLEQVKPSSRTRFPKLSFIDSGEIALMNLVRMNYHLGDGEITLIVYVGVEFTRIILMRGDTHLHFAPLITESSDSPGLSNRLVSRILLERDSHDIATIHRIVLTGNADRTHLKETLQGRFPNTEVGHLKLGTLARAHPEEHSVEMCSEYAIPIAAAWRALEPKNTRFFPVNLLPIDVVERRKIFKVAWHGYMTIALVFFASLFFTWHALRTKVEINAKRDMVIEKQGRIADNTKLQSAIAGLQAKIEKKKGAVTLYESLTTGSNQWTATLKDIANEIHELKSLWLTNITSTPDGGMVITGLSLYRNRIPKLTAHFGNATLKRVTQKQIRERRVYEFELHVLQAAHAK